MIFSNKSTRFLAAAAAVLATPSRAAEEMTLNAGFIQNAASDFMTGAISAIEEQAQANGIDLTINVDSNPITETYNDALSMLDPDCEGIRCYDMIIADYFHTPERSVKVTFAPSFLKTYLTTFVLEGGEYMSFEEADQAGGNICLREGTVDKDVLEQIVTTGVVVPCQQEDFECYENLLNGKCDVYGHDALVGKIEVKNQAAYTDIIIATDEVLLGEEYFIAWPMKSSLIAAKLQGMMTWSFGAIHACEIDDLSVEYLGTAPSAECMASATKYIEYLGNNGNPSGAYPLGECQGDCDGTDEECDEGLICFHRDGGEPVPGCHGGEDDHSRTDYCVSA
jgi:hypothetical protein